MAKLAVAKSGNKTAEQYIGQAGLTSFDFLVYQETVLSIADCQSST